MSCGELERRLEALDAELVQAVADIHPGGFVCDPPGSLRVLGPLHDDPMANLIKNALFRLRDLNQDGQTRWPEEQLREDSPLTMLWACLMLTGTIAQLLPEIAERQSERSPQGQAHQTSGQTA